jgi:hypothetical protein
MPKAAALILNSREVTSIHAGFFLTVVAAMVLPETWCPALLSDLTISDANRRNWWRSQIATFILQSSDFIYLHQVSTSASTSNPAPAPMHSKRCSHVLEGRTQ